MPNMSGLTGKTALVTGATCIDSTVRYAPELGYDVTLAVTAAQLDARGASDISAVAQTMPNETFSTTAGNSGSSNAAVVFIRGVGQDDFFPTIDPGVGIYLDGVYVS